MKVGRFGSGPWGLSFEYKNRFGQWVKEERFFQEKTTRDSMILKIKSNPYHWRIRKI